MFLPGPLSHCLVLFGRSQVFRAPLTPLTSHISTSDPGNNPLSVNSFLEGGADSGPLVNSWANAIEAEPITRRMDQEVLVQSQHQYASAQQQQQRQQATDASFLGTERVTEGAAAKTYEPGQWPAERITPDPYKHLAHRQGGGGNAHNNLEGGLGVSSAALPWEYRQYAGDLNSHRKAEPLIYTPLVLAKSADGASAIDLTSLANRKYQSQRMSKQPQYASTLSALTEQAPLLKDPTDKWLPQVPVHAAPGAAPKLWEKHFLDLYAPTPPPLLSPVPPRMKPTAAQRAAAEAQAQAASLVEVATRNMPSFLTQKARVQSLVTPMLDAQARPLAFRDVEGEAEAMRAARNVDLFAPANGGASDMADDEDAPMVFLQQDEELFNEDALADIDIDTPFPLAHDEEQFPW